MAKKRVKNKTGKEPKTHIAPKHLVKADAEKKIKKEKAHKKATAGIKPKRTSIINLLAITFGSVLFAIAISMFTAPNNIMNGGVTGATTMLNYAFGLPIGIMTIVINVPIFIWGAVENGRKFLFKTVYATVLSAVLIDMSAYFIPVYKGDMLLASLFGGIILGLGQGLIFYGGGTTGGVDIIARNIKNHFPFLSMGNIIIAVDGILVVIAIIMYNSIESGLYAVIAIFVSAKVIDSVVYGFSRDNGQLILIVTEEYKEITSSIIHNIVRGVTVLDAQGGYSEGDKKMLLCAVRPRQVYKVTNLVKALDPNAFLMVTKAGVINGEGFSEKKQENP